MADHSKTLDRLLFYASMVCLACALLVLTMMMFKWSMAMEDVIFLRRVAERNPDQFNPDTSPSSLGAAEVQLRGLLAQMEIAFAALVAGCIGLGLRAAMRGRRRSAAIG